MKLAYTIPNIDTIDLSEAERYIRLLKEIGYEGAETSVCYAKKVDKEGLKSILDKYDFKLSGFRSGGIYDGAGVRFSSPDPEVRATAVAMLKDVIDLAGYFHCDVLLGRIQGLVLPGEDLDTAKGYIVDCMRECSEYAGQYGIYIDYEPITRYEMNYNNTTREMIEFTNHINSTINHKVKLLMDVFHSTMEDESVAGAFIRAGEMMGHLHFSDTNRCSNRGVPGTGTMNFKEFIDVLDALGYKGWIALEVGLDFPDYEWGARTSYTYLSMLIEMVKKAK